MNEIEQLKTVLSDADFWQREDRISSCITGGICVEVTRDPGKWGWQVTWTDRAEVSDRPFPSWQDAKLALREHLRQRLADLAYAATPPAKCEMTFSRSTPN